MTVTPSSRGVVGAEAPNLSVRDVGQAAAEGLRTAVLTGHSSALSVSAPMRYLMS